MYALAADEVTYQFGPSEKAALRNREPRPGASTTLTPEPAASAQPPTKRSSASTEHYLEAT